MHQLLRSRGYNATMLDVFDRARGPANILFRRSSSGGTDVFSGYTPCDDGVRARPLHADGRCTRIGPMTDRGNYMGLRFATGSNRLWTTDMIIPSCRPRSETQDGLLTLAPIRLNDQERRHSSVVF